MRRSGVQITVGLWPISKSIIQIYVVGLAVDESKLRVDMSM